MNDLSGQKTAEEIFREQRFAEIRPTIINEDMIMSEFDVDKETASQWFKKFQETIIHHNQSKSYESFVAYLDDHIAWHDEGDVWFDFQDFVKFRIKND